MDHQIRSIAFPSISTGVYGYPVEQAAKTAVSAVETFMNDHPGLIDEVYWVCFDERTLQAYQNALS